MSSKIKLAYKIKFYGNEACSTCAFTLPLLSLAQKKNLIEEIDLHIFRTKEEYEVVVGDILKTRFTGLWNSFWRGGGYPVPILLVQVKKGSRWCLTRPDVLLGTIQELNTYLQADGDFAVIEWLDNEAEFHNDLLNYLVKLATNLISPVPSN